MRLPVTPLLAAILLQALPAQGPSVDEIVLKRNQEGVSAYEADRFESAIAHFDSAFALDPRNAVIRRNLARALHARAGEIAKEKRPALAAELLRRARSLEPENHQVTLLLVRVLSDSGLTIAARQELRPALVAAPDSPDLLEASGRLHYEDEDLELAQKDLLRAAELDQERKERLRHLLEKIARELEVERGFIREVREPFVVKYDDRAAKDTSTAVLALLDRINNRLEGEFRTVCGRRITVVLYSREDFTRATETKEWSGGVFDGKIRLAVRNFARAESEIAATLTHELAHMFVRSMTRHCPLWLNEGVAQYMEGKEPDPRAEEALRLRHREGTLPAVAALPASWVSISDRATVSGHYAQALSITRFLVRTYGWLPVRDLLAALDGPEAFFSAAQRAFGRPWADVETAWRATLD